MKTRSKICHKITASVALILIVAITYQTIFGGIPTAEAATGYPDTLVGYMQQLAKQDYMFLDVSNMRMQQEGVGPSWNKAATLYYRNVTKGTSWQSSKTSTSESLSEEEKKMVRELKQSNIYCWKITDNDTDLLEFSYSNDVEVNSDHYYRTASYKAGDVKGHLYAYLASYTAKEGDNEGKKAYMIGKVALSELETEENTTDTSEEESVEESEVNSSEEEESTGKEEEIEETEEKEEIQKAADDTSEEYEVEEAEIMADSDIVTIKVVHDFSDKGGAQVIFTKNGSATGTTYIIGTSVGTFEYDLSSDIYDGFYVIQKDKAETGNTTEIRTTDEIKEVANEFGNELTATLGGWTGSVRTLTISGGGSDGSLNIPTGTFTKNKDTLYVKATFYDYYSDAELGGVNRKTYSDGKMTASDKVQADTFNNAIEEYFKDTTLASSTVQSPLYFGDFYSWSDKGGYLNFIKDNNNGEFIKYNGQATARQGLVNEKLVDDNKLVMGTDNIEVPYFSEEFLRGKKYYTDNLGYVFKNVDFPFILNSSGYWEFNSYDSSQTLRMKKDTTTGAYFLDRVGSSGAVHGNTSANGGNISGKTTDSNFFPFNDTSESGYARKLNYAFGMKLEIPFYMTADGKVTMGTNEQDIVFNFLGDDDVWIFIDDTLILDIGGDHGAVAGAINFATRKATTTVQSGTSTKTFTALDPAERHVLTMYYMERGIWESNMQISFNFPQSNKLEVEKEITVPTDSEGNSKVNSIFNTVINEMLLKKISFPVTIQTLATNGDPLPVTEHEEAIDYPFDEINSSTSVKLMSTKSSPTYSFTTKDSLTVLKYTAPRQKLSTEGQDVTDKHSIIINYPTGSLDISNSRLKNGGYIEFDAYLDGTDSGGAFVALIDGNGNRIGGWTDGIVYNGGTGTIKSKTWTTIQVDIAQMTGTSLTKIDGSTAGTFDYSDVVGIQFAHWTASPVYVDDIHIKAPATYGTGTGFTKKQEDIPDYGSIKADTLMPIVGAEYILNPVADENGNTYSYVTQADYSIYLKNTDLIRFTDQFRRESYLYINEVCSQDTFNTTWTIYEDSVKVKSGTGTTVEDGRTETSPGNETVTEPTVATMLFKSYNADVAEDTNHFYNLRVKYTNELKLGSLKIKKIVMDGQGNLVDDQIKYKIRVTFEDIAGMNLESSEYGVDIAEGSIYAENSVIIDPDNSEVTDADKYFVITGIPAGTKYTIEEVQEERDDFILSEIVHTSGTDVDGNYDSTKKVYTGTVVADTEEDATDVITIINNINPVTENGELGGEKIWATAEGNTAPDPLPEGVKLKLQRRFIAPEDSGETYTYEDVYAKDGKTSIEFEVSNTKTEETTIECADGNVITINTGPKSDDEGNTKYCYSVNGLPLYGVVQIDGNNRRRKYEYRFVETAVISNGNTIEVTINNATESNTKADTAVVDSTTGYKITGGTAAEDYDITNTYDPKTSLQITKVSGEDHTTGLKGVTLRLEKMIQNEDGSLVVDTEFNESKGYREATTEDGGILTFLNLPDGIYRLTEIKTVEGYSLMAAPINIVISRLNGSTAGDGNSETTLETSGDIVKITISNQGLLSLPMTGSRGRWYVITLGIALIVGGEGIYLWNMYSHRRKRHSQHKK